MSVILSDEELQLLGGDEPFGELSSPHLIQVLWLQQPPFSIDRDLHNLCINDVDELAVKLQHANELDGLVVNTTALLPSEQHTLAKLLEEQAHLSVFVIGELPAMDFALGDFNYAPEIQQLKSQLTSWHLALKQQFSAWAQRKRIAQYGIDCRQQLSAHGFTSPKTIAQEPTAWPLQLATVDLLILNVQTNDDLLIPLLEHIGQRSNRLRVLLCYQQYNSFFALTKRLAKQLNISIFSQSPLSHFNDYINLITPRSFRLYRHRLRQNARYHEQQGLQISDSCTQQCLGFWNRPQVLPAKSGIAASYWTGNESLPRLTHWRNLLVFAPNFPNDDFRALLALKQQGYEFAWEVQFISELEQRKDLIELVDVLVIPLDLWQQIGLSQESQAYWDKVCVQCQELNVPLAILGGKAELMPYWRDKGFSWVIHQVVEANSA